MATAETGGLTTQILSGPQRAATLLMLLGEEHGRALWSEFTDGEIRTICLAMADLGAVSPAAVQEVIADFMAELEAGSPLPVNVAAAEELLGKLFPAERVETILADIKGDAGRQVWRRLATVPTPMLVGFLRKEYPQTIAVILSKMGADASGRVLAHLPDEVAVDVVARMLRLDDVNADTLRTIESMLQAELLAISRKKTRRDPYEAMADRFGAFDRQTEARLLAAIETADRDAAQRIRAKMFTFEDVLKLDAAGAQTLLRVLDKDVLARALKGAEEQTKTFFLGNMSSRAAKNLADDIDAMAPLRARDVENAQGQITKLAKELADKGEIRIVKARDDDDDMAA